MGSQSNTGQTHEKRNKAMSNESKKDQKSNSRVYSSSQVHKRRASRKPLFGGAKRTEPAAVPEDAVDDAPDAQVPDGEGELNIEERDFADPAAAPQPDQPDAVPVEPLPADSSAPSVEPEPAPDPQAGAPAARAAEPDPQITVAMPAVAQPADGGDGRGTLMDHAEFSGFFNESDDAVENFKAETAKASKRRTIIIVVVALVAIALVAAIAVFGWNRWGRYDDQADIKGQWFVAGTSVPVTIDDNNIVLTDEVSYAYTIDQNEKTIRYTFGQTEGQGRYWFTDDRKYLVITDGDEYTSASTAVEDLVRTFRDLGTVVSGDTLKLPEGKGIIAFSRVAEKASRSSSATASSSSAAASSASAESSASSASAQSQSSAAASSEAASPASADTSTDTAADQGEQQVGIGEAAATAVVVDEATNVEEETYYEPNDETSYDEGTDNADTGDGTEQYDDTGEDYVESDVANEGDGTTDNTEQAEQ